MRFNQSDHAFYLPHFMILFVFCQIHDVAEFLGGDLRSKNQHILIEYKKNGMRQSPSQSVSTPVIEINSSTQLALQSSFLGTSPVMKLEVFDREGQKSPILRPKSPNSNNQLHSPRTEALKSQKLNQSLSNPDLRSIRHGVDKSYTHSSSSSNVRMDLCTSPGGRPLPPPPPGHETEVMQTHSKFKIRSNSMGKPLTPRSSRRLRRKSERDNDLNSSSSSSELDLPPYQPMSSKSLHNPKSTDSLNLKYRPSASPDSMSHSTAQFRRIGSNESARSASGSFDSDDEDEVNLEGLVTTELHLYVLTENSPMFAYLKSTWNNCIMVSV